MYVCSLCMYEFIKFFNVNTKAKLKTCLLLDSQSKVQQTKIKTTKDQSCFI